MTLCRTCVSWLWRTEVTSHGGCSAPCAARLKSMLSSSSSQSGLPCLVPMFLGTRMKLLLAASRLPKDADGSIYLCLRGWLPWSCSSRMQRRLASLSTRSVTYWSASSESLEHSEVLEVAQRCTRSTLEPAQSPPLVRQHDDGVQPACFTVFENRYWRDHNCTAAGKKVI